MGGSSDGCWLVRAIGLLCLAVCVLLSLPGIEIARAEDGALMTRDPALERLASDRAVEPTGAPSECAAGSSDPEADIARQQQEMIAELARRAAELAEAQGADTGPEIIVLNGSGYNYSATGQRPGARPASPAQIR